MHNDAKATKGCINNKDGGPSPQSLEVSKIHKDYNLVFWSLCGEDFVGETVSEALMWSKLYPNKYNKITDYTTALHAYRVSVTMTVFDLCFLRDRSIPERTHHVF
jgi:hypothetical protein